MAGIIDKLTDLKLGTGHQGIVHSRAVNKSIRPEVFELPVFSKVENAEGMIGAGSEVQISLSIQIFHDVFLIVGRVGSEEDHPREEIHQGLSKMSAHDGLAEHPGEEVARVEVILERLLASAMRWRGNVKLVFSSGDRIAEIAAIGRGIGRDLGSWRLGEDLGGETVQ